MYTDKSQHDIIIDTPNIRLRAAPRLVQLLVPPPPVLTSAITATCSSTHHGHGRLCLFLHAVAASCASACIAARALLSRSGHLLLHTPPRPLAPPMHCQGLRRRPGGVASFQRKSPTFCVSSFNISCVLFQLIVFALSAFRESNVDMFRKMLNMLKAEC